MTRATFWFCFHFKEQVKNGLKKRKSSPLTGPSLGQSWLLELLGLEVLTTAVHLACFSPTASE